MENEIKKYINLFLFIHEVSLALPPNWFLISSYIVEPAKFINLYKFQLLLLATSN